ncbi:MAG: S8 family serine peptidase [Candidatus Krumholzibacteria bacterium]|nr:S8 family serine peptidase [Candidatus Krumholzibacteria bacterium]
MKVIIFSICICLLASLHVEAQESAPKQIIVSFENKEDDVLQVQNGQMTCMFSSVMGILESYNATSMRRLYSGNMGAQNIYIIELESDADVDAAIAELNSDPEIRSATRNYAIEFLTTPNDWYFNNDYIPPGDSDPTEDQWYLKVIQADKSWDVQRGSPGVTIGIMDTGIDFFHQDLENNIWVNPGEDLDADGVVWDTDDLNGVDDDGNGKVDDLVGWDFKALSPGDNYPYPDTLVANPPYQHGTMMASVGAVTNNDTQPGDTSIAGISWHCKIAPLRVDFWYGSVVEALNYAATKGFDVVNMSFHIPDLLPGDKEILHEAVIAAKNAGVVMVAAVNPGSPGWVTYPHGFEEVIAVTVVDENGVMKQGYGYHSGVDVCGLGISDQNWRKRFPIFTYDYRRSGPPLYPGSIGPHGYWWHQMSTSYAAAQVSTVAGLLKSQYPDATPDFIQSEIERGADPVDAANQNQPWYGLLGAGRINPYRSLTQWGTIWEDTTWSGVVYLSGDIVVYDNVTLTIDPGTVIYVAPEDNANLYHDPERIAIGVCGTLNANGTAENPILFKSLSDEPLPGDWCGIGFARETATGSLSHCDIRDAVYGVESKVTIAMHGCRISNCSIAGIYMYDDMDSLSVVNNESTISNCTITENASVECSAMRIWNCPLVITISSDTVSMNYRGIWVSNARPTISYCEIASNEEDGVWVTSYRYPQPYPYPTISHCQIHLNGESGIHCMWNKAQVSYTKTWQNGTYGILAYGVDAYPVIDHSKIINNAAAGVRGEVGGRSAGCQRSATRASGWGRTTRSTVRLRTCTTRTHRHSAQRTVGGVSCPRTRRRCTEKRIILPTSRAIRCHILPRSRRISCHRYLLSRRTTPTHSAPHRK